MKSKRPFYLWVRVFCLLGLAAELTACSTVRPYHSGRRGLFDRLAMGEERQGRSSQSGSSIRKNAELAREVPSRNPARENASLASVQRQVQGWRWPLDQVVVTSEFGERGSSFHEGVDLVAKMRTPIYAVDSGRVLYTGGKIKGYGRMVILKHPKSGLISVYAHLTQELVKKGKWVKKGQKIALSGKTGRVTGPHLHFEIRKGVMAYDPVKVLLPSRRAVRVAQR